MKPTLALFLTVLRLAPVAPLHAKESDYGLRLRDFDVFDRADAYLSRHNVARADYRTTVTLRRPDGSTQAVTHVNDGVIVQSRKDVCQLPGTGGELSFQFTASRSVHAVRVFSGDLPNNWDLPSGEMSIRRFRVEGRVNRAWIKLAEMDKPLPGYVESATSIGPYTHHAVVSFPERRVEALRLISLETNDTGKRMDPPETVPVEKRIALIREVEIFSSDPAIGPVRVPLKRLVETDWSLPAYLNTATANLVVLPRPWLKQAVTLEVAFREERSGTGPVPPLRLEILPEEKPQRFPLNIAAWPDGEYITHIRLADAGAGGSGEVLRRLIKQTLVPPQPPTEPVAVKGITVVPVDDWYFAETANLRRVLHPAEQYPVVAKPLTPGRIRMDGLSLKLDASGDLLVEVEDMDRYSQHPQRHMLRSKDGIRWELEKPAAGRSTSGKTSQFQVLPKPETPSTDVSSARLVLTGAALLASAAVAAPEPKPLSKPASKGLPDNNQAKWKYQDKNAPIAAQPHRHYDPARDGPVNLAQVTVRHARHYPPKWGDIEIPPYTVWPVWKKADDDYVILTRKPLTEHIMGNYEDEPAAPHIAGDGWWGGYPEISADKKTIYWMQYRMIPRFPPFRVGYDLARGMQRHVVLWSSRDGVHWEQTFTTLPGEEDEIGTQHYGGMLLNREGNRLTLCYQWTYRSGRQQMCLDLAYSRDMRFWQRIPGPAFSPNGPLGSWNYGFATTTGGPEVDKDGYSYRLTGRDGSTPHFGWEVLNRDIPLESITGKYLEKRFEGLGMRQMPNWADFASYDNVAEHLRTTAFRSVGILRYRKNGWVSLQTDADKPGIVVTKVLKAGRTLTLNAKTAAHGSIRVELLDEESQPLPDYSGAKAAVFSGDSVAGALVWSGGTVTALPNRTFRVRLTLNRADLFALNFEDAPAPSQGERPRGDPARQRDPARGHESGDWRTAARHRVASAGNQRIHKPVTPN